MIHHFFLGLMIFNFLKKNKAISTHNQLYRKENKNILPAVRNENESDMAGPRTGKSKTYSRLIIPIVKRMAPREIMLNLFLKKEKAAPIPIPNNPVVKGKTTSSLGNRMNSNRMVIK